MRKRNRAELDNLHFIRAEAGMFLEQMGFSGIINLHGGVAAWARDVDPKMPTY